MTELSYGAAFLLGLLGGSHCIVMCGGIGAALGLGTSPTQKYQTLALFQFGRVITYTLLGAGLGAVLGQLAALSTVVMPLLRILSGLLLIAMGCYLASWWRGLLLLERLGQHVWRRVEPRAKSLLPVQGRRQALAIGMYWGLLPCGLIYTALAWSASAAHWLQSGALMFCFGLGTLPVMYATGLAGERLAAVLRRKDLRNAVATLLIAAGGWTSWIAVVHTPPADTGSAHQHHQNL